MNIQLSANMVARSIALDHNFRSSGIRRDQVGVLIEVSDAVLDDPAWPAQLAKVLAKLRRTHGPISSRAALLRCSAHRLSEATGLLDPSWRTIRAPLSVPEHLEGLFFELIAEHLCSRAARIGFDRHSELLVIGSPEFARAIDDRCALIRSRSGQRAESRRARVSRIVKLAMLFRDWATPQPGQALG